MKTPFEARLAPIVPFVAFWVACAVAWALWQDGTLPPALALHAGLMIAAWGILLPAGALVARHWKVLRGQNYPAILDNRFWWLWHLGLQVSGLVVATIALFAADSAHWPLANGWHVAIGFLVIALGWSQVIAGLLRGSKGGPTDGLLRGDHYDMTPRRVRFERFHKVTGWLAVPLAFLTMALGADLVGAPAWLLASIAAVAACVVTAAVLLQKTARTMPTYQAIWGPDPRHPGNQGRKSFSRLREKVARRSRVG